MRACEVTPSETRLGLNVTLPGESPCEISPIWSVAGWEMQFVRLQPDTTKELDQSSGIVHVKVITGALTNIALGPFAEPRTVRSTVVDAAEVTAGVEGSIFVLLTATDEVADTIATMDQLGFDGPHADLFVWQSFFDRFRGAEMFKGVDAHMVPGFHLLDVDGTEIVYLHFWTMGKGEDSSTHNHSHAPSDRAPAFAEIHWVFNCGTGTVGMYECDTPDAPRTMTLMQRGEEHGPFWTVEPATGMPCRRPNGAVEYGWHGWQAGTDDRPGQAYDLVAAFEINPDYATVTNPF